MPQSFYRIIKNDLPVVDDFMSQIARGRVAPGADAETQRLAHGISVYQTEQQARRKARAMPRLGNFIVEVHIPDDAEVRVERTTSSTGHYTLWGAPELFITYGRGVVPV